MQALPTPVAEACGSGLRTLDELVRAKDYAGYIAVRTRDTATAIAVERHLVRRARQLSRPVAATDTASVDSCWRELAERLGASPLPSDPADAAKALVRDGGRAIAVVVGGIARGSWDDEVLAELVRAPDQLLLVHVSAADSQADRFGEVRSIRVQGEGAEELGVWWQGVVDEGPQSLRSPTLAELDRWWMGASRWVPSEGGPALSVGAGELLARLRLSRRSWPESLVSSLGSIKALNELVDAGCVVRDRAHVVVLPEAGAPASDEQSAAVVAAALERHFELDPWALARASELYATAGQVHRGEACLARALREVEGALARRQLWSGWCEALDELQPDARRSGALRGAELALDLDDVEIAVRLAQTASAGAESIDRATSFVLGKAQLARGDLAAARVSLERALAEAGESAEASEILAHLAELAYLAGEHDAAASRASEALHNAPSPAVLLHARNTLGKLLLARSQWDQAEAHFAADEYDANRWGLELGKMRARVNRAVAMVSKRSIEEARSLLESVLADAEQARELRATAFALSNLAVLAIERHDYVEALGLCERAIDARRRLGDRVGLARIVVNLAELRLKLGMLEAAEQALAFGRRTVAPSVPAGHAAVFSLVSAWIQLARGRTSEAWRELASAQAGIAGWSDGARVAECHRLAVRLALEDGDTRRAAAALEQASQHADSAAARAETALLEALLLRAGGEDATGQAARALTIAAEAHDEELLRECNVLLCELARGSGSMHLAQAYLRSAEQLRDQVAAALPEPLRGSYLGRRDIASLSVLSSSLRDSVRAELVQPVSRAPAERSALAAPRFVGRHPSVLRLLGSVRKVAASNAPVLVSGESGTGKELIAEAIHALSPRAHGPLVKVNCAALVESLLLSELFGHEKGSFTGAAGKRRGRFELADGGTLFLDEIGDISPKTQVALLRVLQEHSFERVGGTATIRTDVRIVCATHRDLKAMVADGTFREDLYYRLCGITLEVPALRRRVEDVAVLSAHLLQRIARERKEPVRKLAPEALALLEHHGWPGNVRELDNVLRAASLFADDELITRELVAEQLRTAGPERSLGAAQDDGEQDGAVFVPAGPEADTTRVAYEEIRKRGTSLSDLKRQIERDCIERALAETRGNITKAATLLGMKRPRLSQLVKQYELLGQTSEDL